MTVHLTEPPIYPFGSRESGNCVGRSQRSQREAWFQCDPVGRGTHLRGWHRNSREIDPARGDRGRISGGTDDPMAKIRPIDADNGRIGVCGLRFDTLCEPRVSVGVFLADAMDISSQGLTKPPDRSTDRPCPKHGIILLGRGSSVAQSPQHVSTPSRM